MSAKRRKCVQALGLWAALWLPGCGSTAMPGTALGTFTINASSKSNSCGSSLGAPDPWSFDAELSRDGSTLWWRQNGNLFSGTLDAVRTATIAATVTSQVSTADAGGVDCAMSRDDTITVTLGSSDNVTSLSGTIGFTFSVVTGSDCSTQLSANGGKYDALPCSLDYSFSGTRTKAP